jgi:hypothetical protein
MTLTRPCENRGCPQRMEWIDTTPNGLQLWQCPNDHVLLVSPPRVKAEPVALPQADGWAE